MSTIFRVEKTANFTVMSNLHLKDRRLSYKSKGLLSVILSLPPEWDYTITGLAVIAADGVESVKTAIKELEKYGYVTRTQLRDERGRMAQNEYLVYENPQDNPDYVPDDQSVSAPNVSENKPSISASKKHCKEHFSVSPSTEKPLTKNPLTDNPEADTIIKLNNNILNTNKSIHSFITPEEERDDKIELIDSYSKDNISIASFGERELYRQTICDNINFDEAFASSFDKCEQVEEMVSIMTDVVCSSSPKIRVNGEEMSREVVKNCFLNLTEEEIDYVLYALKHNSRRIGNMRSYLITTLYNSKSTKSNFYANMACNDIREGRI